MSSLIDGFAYDIFISYRQNDNQSGWVTEFAKHLREELLATVKDPVSIYLDSNPVDGLLETHHVDKSLEEKLKCLIFIPILSQTYCDTKSFAWSNEFIPFNKKAVSEEMGREIKLANGNVASRVLPIVIHDLDPEDRILLENELGGPVRGIEFIFRSPGVNRPLRSNEDHASENQNKTYYRDQMNKVANAVKETLGGIKNRNRAGSFPKAPPVPPASPRTRKWLALSAAIIFALALASFFLAPAWISGGLAEEATDKSIAVLPFENMSNDSTQDYFSNGITEDILNHLVKIADLRVKSRTSTLQYKGTTKTVSEIGDDLNVGNVVEGSVRRIGNRVRIVVQLIDANTDTHLWSETYDRDLHDVFAVQSEIALAIATALKTRLTATETRSIQQEVSQDVTAYDFYLRAREAYKNTNFNRNKFEIAFRLVNEALRLDPKFADAYALKGWLWYEMKTFGIEVETWRDSAITMAAKAIALNPTSPKGYLLQYDLFQSLGKLKESRAALQSAYELAPNDVLVLNPYGFQLLKEGDERGADMQLRSLENRFSPKDPEYFRVLALVHQFLNDPQTAIRLLVRSIEMDPGAIDSYIQLAEVYESVGNYEEGLKVLREAGKINADYQFRIDLMAELSYYNGDYDTAAKYWSMYPEIEARFEDRTQIVPFRHRLAMTYLKMNRKQDADKLFREDLELRRQLVAKQRANATWGAGIGGTFYDLALDETYFGNKKIAVQYLDSAQYYGFYYWWGLHHDDLLVPLRGREDFERVFGDAKKYWAFRSKAFEGALTRSRASADLKRMLEK